MTSESASLRSALLFGSTYVFPVAGFPLIAFAWWLASGGSWPFLAVVMGIPAGLVILCLVPTLVFLAVDAPTRRLLRRRFAGGGAVA